MEVFLSKVDTEKQTWGPNRWYYGPGGVGRVWIGPKPMPEKTPEEEAAAAARAQRVIQEAIDEPTTPRRQNYFGRGFFRSQVPKPATPRRR